MRELRIRVRRGWIRVRGDRTRVKGGLDEKWRGCWTNVRERGVDKG